MKKHVLVVGLSACAATLIAASSLAGAAELAVKDDVHPAKIKGDVHPAPVNEKLPATKQHAYDLNPNELSATGNKRGVVINHEEQYRAFPKK